MPNQHLGERGPDQSAALGGQHSYHFIPPYSLFFVIASPPLPSPRPSADLSAALRKSGVGCAFLSNARKNKILARADMSQGIKTFDAVDNQNKITPSTSSITIAATSRRSKVQTSAQQ